MSQVTPEQVKEATAKADKAHPPQSAEWCKCVAEDLNSDPARPWRNTAYWRFLERVDSVAKYVLIALVMYYALKHWGVV